MCGVCACPSPHLGSVQHFAHLWVMNWGMNSTASDTLMFTEPSGNTYTLCSSACPALCYISQVFVSYFCS